MNVMWIIVLCYGILQVTCEFPTDIKKCAMTDSPCIMASTQYVIEKYAKSGLRELNLIPLDPLHVKSIKLKRNPASPVNVELNFSDVDLIGLHDVKVIKLNKIDPNDLTNCLHIEFATPKFSLKGPYTVDGNVLILPIVGKGEAVITAEDSHIKIRGSCQKMEKSGGTYIQVDALKLELNPKRATYKLSGLFNGNKELGDNMNLFLNENWREIFDQLAPSFSEALALISKQMLNNIFSKYPFEEFFLES